MTHVSFTGAILPCLLMCLVSALPLGAQTQGPGPAEEGGVMIWGALGFQGDFGGHVNSSGVGVLNGRRAELDANTWGERYDPGLVFRVGGAYNLTGDAQLTGSFGWEQAESDSAEAGLLAGVPIEVGFSDYQAWGFDIGYRQFLVTNYTARPFIGGALGFQHVDAITMDMTSPAGLAVTGLPFYDDSWVVQWRIGTGLLWDINERFGAQVTIDLKYSGVLSDVSGLGSLGFERINDQGNRWTFPVLVGAFVRF
jgi:hypothetical protein